MAMEVVQDDIWFCVDCTMYAVNGDLPEENEHDVTEGVNAYGPHLVMDDDPDTGEGHDDFSSCRCDACGSRLAGERYRFAVLGKVAV
jgi:hypothetical protein